MHGPRLADVVESRDSPVLQRDGDATGDCAVVAEVAFYGLALVSECHVEVREPERVIVLHDVPEDRVRPDLDHRLRPRVGFLRKPGPEPARKDHDLHGSDPSPTGSSSTAHSSRGRASWYVHG